MIRNVFSLFVFLVCLQSFAQEITIEGIYGGRYREKYLEDLKPLNDGKSYTTLTREGIEKYSYESALKKNGERGNMLLSGRFDGYEFSPDERYILFYTEFNPIYRHSFTAKYEVFDTQTRSKTFVYGGKPIQEPLFSPDASKIAFAFENNLYIQDLKTKKVVQVTNDGKKNNVINGINDWVYEEEFSFVRNYDWNADGTSLAFVRFDESKVKEVNLPIYHNNLYPKLLNYKYPKAGEENSAVTLHIFDTRDNGITNVDLSSVQNYYIPKIKFSKKSNLLAVVTSNRHQNNVDVSFYDLKAKRIDKLFTETNKAWIEMDALTLDFLPDNTFLWASERDGNRHLYHYDEKGALKNQVTKGNWEVTNYYGYNPESKTLYYQSNSNNNKRVSTERQIFEIGLNGEKNKMITKNKGTNSAEFSKNYSYFINTFSSIDTPKTVSLIKTDSGKDLGTILENNQIKNNLVLDNAGTKELFVLKTAQGNELNAYVIKPKNFDPKKKYPVLMTQYSGPGSQSVTNTYFNTNDYWHLMLAQQGYLVYCVDGRGTGYRGEKFKKLTYLQLGKYEVEDQIAAAKEISKLPYIDSSRIGIWGWSFGGFMATNALFKGNDVFKTAIAVAPVTNWRYYDSIYTERFMRTPQENASGYDDNSPINHVNGLKGNLLLIHGSADDNVHPQNTFELSEALVQANKDFDMAIYTDKNHGIYGGYTRIQLYRKMTNYIKKNL